MTPSITGEWSEWFEANRGGPRVVKWNHYFEPYTRHLSKYKGTPVRVVEVGINDGGSLAMWRWYFGSRAKIFGVDINNRTLSYASDPQYGSPDDIHIQDMNEESAWDAICAKSGPFDVIIDDASHRSLHQVRSLARSVTPCVRDGGVVIIEDVFGDNNPTIRYAIETFLHVESRKRKYATTDTLYATRTIPSGVVPSNLIQRVIKSLVVYPFLLVVERHSLPCNAFSSIASGHLTMPNPPLGHNLWGRWCSETDKLQRQCNIDGSRKLPSTLG